MVTPKEKEKQIVKTHRENPAWVRLCIEVLEEAKRIKDLGGGKIRFVCFEEKKNTEERKEEKHGDRNNSRIFDQGRFPDGSGLRYSSLPGARKGGVKNENHRV